MGRRFFTMKIAKNEIHTHRWHFSTRRSRTRSTSVVLHNFVCLLSPSHLSSVVKFLWRILHITFSRIQIEPNTNWKISEFAHSKNGFIDCIHLCIALSKKVIWIVNSSITNDRMKKGLFLFRRQNWHWISCTINAFFFLRVSTAVYSHP